MLEFRGVSKIYGRAAGGRVEALADLSFEVKPTELAVLAGPGDAGKSTLLRLITGEERPTRGAVLVDGIEVGGLGARGLARLRRSLGVVSQGGRLLPDRTALGNLTFVLRALGTGSTEARERALAALTEVGLGAARNALPHELAAGECRRVMLARALATRPRLLLADEPTAMLDAAACAMVVTLLRGLSLKGTTCLVATQAVAVARAFEGRAELRVVAVLRDAGPRPEGPDGVVARARAVPGVAEVRYVGPAVALAELRRLLGPRGEGLDRLPSNPLPPRIEVTPVSTMDAGELQALVEALDRLPGVIDVQAAHGWIEPLERLRRGLRLGGLGLAAVLGLAALAAATGATAAARRAGADEMSILRLAGVSELRLAVPLVLQALGLATLGSLLGLALLLLASEPGALWTGSWLRAVLGLDPLPLLPPSWLVALTGGGATLGLVGALAAGRS